MKLLLFVVAGFFAGFGAVLGVRGFQPGVAADSPPAAQAQLRSVEVPRDFISGVSARLANVRSLPADGKTIRLLQRDIDRWMLADPMSCVELLHRNGALGLIRIEHLPAVFSGAFRGNLALAIREAAYLPDVRLRFEWLNAAFMEAAQRSPEDALELLPYLPTERRSHISRRIIQHFAEKDPLAAWKAVVQARTSPYKHGFEWRQDDFHWANVVLDVWGERDADGLAVFLKSKLAGRRSDWESRLLANALEGFGQGRHATHFLRVLAETERNSTMEKLWRQGVQTVARKNLEDALRIATAEPRRHARDRAVVVIANTVEAADLERALGILQRVPAEPARAAAVYAMLQSAAGKDPVSAAERAEKIPNLLRRAEAMRMVAWTWYTRYQSAKLPHYALEAGVPDVGPSWLGMMAETLRAAGDNGGNWGYKLDEGTREQFEAAIRMRLTEEEWTRVGSMFSRFKRK